MKENTSLRQPLGRGMLTLLLAFVCCVTILNCAEKKISDDPIDVENLLDDSVYIQQGNRIVVHSFDTLRNSLLGAIASQGMEEAITFCNEKAYPITDIYADSVVIRRTSLRYRNPTNKPDSLELAMLNAMNAEMNFSNTAESRVIRQQSTGEIHFFKPILTQAMCLNCHGTLGVQVKDKTLARIQQLYPEDRAMNFKEGDLRGAWHIIFRSHK
jgi:hypothetical protein